MDRLDRMLELVHDRVPGLRIVHKHDVPWMRALGMLLRPLNPTFSTHYTTVVGQTIYLPSGPPRSRDRQAINLGHELIHLLDMDLYGLSFYATYLAAPTPFGRTWRARWERRGYAVDLLIAKECGGDAALNALHHELAVLFSGPAYGWMWAGRDAAHRFLQPTVDAVHSGTLADDEPYCSILRAWRGTDGTTPEAPWSPKP